MCIEPSNNRRRAFSLIELMISFGIGSLLIVVLCAFSLYSGRSFEPLFNYVDLNQSSRNALDVMTRDIRQVNRLTDFGTNYLTFEDWDSAPLHYVYNPQTKRLRRIKGSGSVVLLENCTYLDFKIYQRNPIAGTYDQ